MVLDTVPLMAGDMGIDSRNYSVISSLSQKFAAMLPKPTTSGRSVCEAVRSAAVDAAQNVELPHFDECTTLKSLTSTTPGWMTCYRQQQHGVCEETTFRVALRQRAEILSAITIFAGIPADSGVTAVASLSEISEKLREFLLVQRIHLMACNKCDFVTFQTFAVFFALHGKGNIAGNTQMHNIQDCPEFTALPYHWQRRHWMTSELLLSRLRFAALSFEMKVKMVWVNSGTTSPFYRAQLSHDTMTLHWTDVPLLLVERRAVTPNRGICTISMSAHLDDVMEHLFRRAFMATSQEWLLQVNVRQYIASQIYRCCKSGLLTGTRSVFDLLEVCPNLSMRTDMVRSVCLRDGVHPFMKQEEVRDHATEPRAKQAIHQISSTMENEVGKVVQLLELLRTTAPPCITQLLLHIKDGRNTLKHYGRRQLVLFLKTLGTPQHLLLSLMAYGCRNTSHQFIVATTRETTHWMQTSAETELSCHVLIHNHHQQSSCPYSLLCGGDQKDTDLRDVLQRAGFDMPECRYDGKLLSASSDCRAICMKVAQQRGLRTMRPCAYPTEFMSQHCKRVAMPDSSEDESV